jgi:hypothetical protein
MIATALTTLFITAKAVVTTPPEFHCYTSTTNFLPQVIVTIPNVG